MSGMPFTSTSGKIVDARAVSGPANGIPGDVLEAYARRCWVVACTYILVLNCGSSRRLLAIRHLAGVTNDRQRSREYSFFFGKQNARVGVEGRWAAGKPVRSSFNLPCIFRNLPVLTCLATNTRRRPCTARSSPNRGQRIQFMHSERESAAKWDFAGVPIWNG